MPERIDIDRDIDENGAVTAVHCVVLDDTKIIDDPELAGNLLTVGEYLAWLDQHPELHEQTGWGITSKASNARAGDTRWDVMVDGMNALADSNPLKVKGMVKRNVSSKQPTKR